MSRPSTAWPLRCLSVTLLSLLGACDNGTSPVIACLDEEGRPLPLQPESLRVDLGTPTFSNPTVGTNPLFPVDQVTSYLQLGIVDGQPFRAEVTLLPTTRIITWNGQPIEVVESQYVAFLGGRIHETAIDWYAQADDNSVWYLGEDVFNYADGVVADLDGTWQAGRDGTAAMIMPGSPQVNNVYRPENICGVVFEEVTVEAIGITVNGPTGTVTGAINVKELHQDGAYEDKTFAPGYGEFTTGFPGDNESMALAVPVDALSTAPPAQLATILAGTDSISDAAQAGNWTKANNGLAALTTAWNTFGAGSHPPLLEAQMSSAVAGLTTAVNAQQSANARQRAIGVAYATHDFRLRYLPPEEIDLARLELWARQVQVDAAVSAAASVLGDAAMMEWIRDRVGQSLSAADRAQLNSLVSQLRNAANARNYTAATQAAAALRTFVAGV